MDIAPTLIRMLRVMWRAYPARRSLIEWWIVQVQELSTAAPVESATDEPAEIGVEVEG